MIGLWRVSVRRGWHPALWLVLPLALALGCDRERAEGDSPPVSAKVKTEKSAGVPIGPPSDRPVPRVGMVYIPPGALVVGTPAGQRPWRADREPPGEQIMLEGFYIDQYPYPNEEGAIPETSVSQSEARALCERHEKRLCSELEWERACKGPDNRKYEYGQRYDAVNCKTGGEAQLRPSGFHVGCQSDFGVRDMHGGPFEWTGSEFGRGVEGKVAIRGGNGVDGEVIGRCANVESEDPDAQRGSLGFRCCHGDENPETVELELSHAAGLIPRARFPEELETALIQALPEEAKKQLDAGGSAVRHRVWLWRPVANEELHLLALCGRGDPAAGGARCGLLIARVAQSEIQALAWVSSGRWVANLHRPGPHEYLWLVGGDLRGSFKRLIRYQYGAVEVGEVSRGGPKTKKR